MSSRNTRTDIFSSTVIAYRRLVASHYLTAAQAAQVLGVGEATVRRLRSAGGYGTSVAESLEQPGVVDFRQP